MPIKRAVFFQHSPVGLNDWEDTQEARLNGLNGVVLYRPKACPCALVFMWSLDLPAEVVVVSQRGLCVNPS